MITKLVALSNGRAKCASMSKIYVASIKYNMGLTRVELDRLFRGFAIYYILLIESTNSKIDIVRACLSGLYQKYTK